MCLVSPDGKDGKTKGCEELHENLTVMNISGIFNTNSVGFFLSLVMSNWSSVLTYAKSISTHFNNLEDKTKWKSNWCQTLRAGIKNSCHVSGGLRTCCALETFFFFFFSRRSCTHLSKAVILFLKHFTAEIHTFWLLHSNVFMLIEKRNLRIIIQLGQQRKAAARKIFCLSPKMHYEAFLWISW